MKSVFLQQEIQTKCTIKKCKIVRKIKSVQAQMSWDEWDEYSYLTLTELLTMVYTPWCEFIVRFLNPYVMNRMCTYVKYSMQVGDGSVNSLCSKNIQLKR